MQKSDIQIAQDSIMLPIEKVAEALSIPKDYVENYGKYKAKIQFKDIISRDREDGKLILITAINPTPAGEGKTTTCIGLSDALRALGKNVSIALREPSLGPVFGMKGGAAGGGYAQVVPMEDINLHFTGDIHAIGAANNLLAALIDNHIYHGNHLSIDTNRITFKRCMDMNDRQLRDIVDGLGGRTNGVTREDGFTITVASEIMAIFCLATSITDLKNRLSKIIIGYTHENQPITAKDLRAEGALTALLKDAIKPNLVQTLEHTPAFIHGGPFANIAHGCNSLIATKTALKLSDYVVTEAGFGADLGAEKFLDIKCRKASLKPAAVVIVATVRSLKYNGGVKKSELSKPNLTALKEGMPNLQKHIENIQGVYKLPVIVAINKFPNDTLAELDLIKSECEKLDVEVALSTVWSEGSKGGIELAQKVLTLISTAENNFEYCYDLNKTVRQKIKAIVTKVYGGQDVIYSLQARRKIKKIEQMGLSNLPICIAKTQYSFSDNAKLLGRPEGFTINVTEITVSAGAGFIVVLTGKIMTMPGLPKVPSAELIDVDDDGNISGLF